MIFRNLVYKISGTLCMFNPKAWGQITSYEAERRRLTQIFKTAGENAFRQAVRASWFNPVGHGELFGFCSKSRTGEQAGCLTQIRMAAVPMLGLMPIYKAETPELTAAIGADERLPKYYAEIMPEHLSVFVEWQLRMDKELGRETPLVPTPTQLTTND